MPWAKTDGRMKRVTRDEYLILAGDSNGSNKRVYEEMTVVRRCSTKTRTVNECRQHIVEVDKLVESSVFMTLLSRTKHLPRQIQPCKHPCNCHRFLPLYLYVDVPWGAPCRCSLDSLTPNWLVSRRRVRTTRWLGCLGCHNEAWLLLFCPVWEMFGWESGAPSCIEHAEKGELWVHLAALHHGSMLDRIVQVQDSYTVLGRKPQRYDVLLATGGRPF